MAYDAKSIIVIIGIVLLVIAGIVAAVDFAGPDHQLSQEGLSAVLTLAIAAAVIIVVGVIVLALFHKA